MGVLGTASVCVPINHRFGFLPSHGIYHTQPKSLLNKHSVLYLFIKLVHFFSSILRHFKISAFEQSFEPSIEKLVYPIFVSEANLRNPWEIYTRISQGVKLDVPFGLLLYTFVGHLC